MIKKTKQKNLADSGENLMNKIVLIKYGGAVIEDNSSIPIIVKEILKAQKKQKIKIIIVHGGSKKIDREMTERGLEIKKIDGIRYTDEKVIEVLDKCCGEINNEIVKAINDLGGQAKGFHGLSDDIIITEKTKNNNYGLVGVIKKINIK